MISTIDELCDALRWPRLSARAKHRCGRTRRQFLAFSFFPIFAMSRPKPNHSESAPEVSAEDSSSVSVICDASIVPDGRFLDSRVWLYVADTTNGLPATPKRDSPPESPEFLIGVHLLSPVYVDAETCCFVRARSKFDPNANLPSTRVRLRHRDQFERKELEGKVRMAVKVNREEHLWDITPL